MDQIRIIRRALSTTLNYRALWLFGIILALTTASVSNRNVLQYNIGEDDRFRLPNGTDFEFSPQVVNSLIALIIGLACIFLILALVSVYFRYISENSLIQMVNRVEETGDKLTVRQGFQLGRSRPALRMFLLDLVLGVIGFVVVILLFALAAAPLLLWTTGRESYGILGTVITVGLAMLVIFFLIIAGTLLSLVIQLARRSMALEGLGTFEAFGRGWQMVRRRPWDILLLALILFGIGLGFGILMIPVVLLLFVLALFTGALPGLLVGWLVSLFAEGAAPWIAGGVVGVPLFLTIMAVPLTFINGLFETFKSSTWTLAFRELKALETTALEPPLDEQEE